MRKMSLSLSSLLFLCLTSSAFAVTSAKKAVTPKDVAPAAPVVGSPAPEFTADTATGSKQTLSALKGKFVVLEWYNKDCPFVRKQYDSNKMQGLQSEFTGKGVAWFQVLSSGKGKEGFQDGPHALAQLKNEKSPESVGILLDPKGTLGKLYQAKTTPHMFIIDPKGVLIYAGAIDSKATAEKEDVKTSQNYVEAALNEAMATPARPVTIAATKSYGCSVHYQ